MNRILLKLFALVAEAFGDKKSAAEFRWRVKVLQTLGEVMGPYRRGDYETALKAAEGFKRDGQITRSYCFYRGSMLERLGRLEEAEKWLRRHIDLAEQEENRRYVAIGHSKLGNLLVQAGRYQEAKQCFERSMRHFPGRSSGYRNMAELCLVRGDRPAEAVRWAKLAMEREQADRMSAELRRLNTGEILATQAWATAAETHNIGEVTALVAQARASVGTSDMSSTALVEYQSGRAFAELGDKRRAVEHYEAAAKLDPQGRWGRAARAAISG
jgi:tetratricopeptide (TPR) repeat protein